MTVTYDPDHPAYYDEPDLREELTRVYDLCHGCRLCFNLCPSFPTMFRHIDGHDGAVDALTEAQQDQVVDECYQCKLCYVKCPYTPPHEWQLDFPRLMLRADAVRNKSGQKTAPQRLADQFLGRTDLLGKVSSVAAPVLNRLVPEAPNSLQRKALERTFGIAADRLMPTFARQRFSKWFKSRARPRLTTQQASVSIFATCLVEYQNPSIGQDVVKVYERNGVSCDLPDGQVCCGMPWLDGGDVDSFRKQARQNVRVLARAVRRGRVVVVPQPTCGYVLKSEYPEYVKTADTRLVADNTYDASEYLWKLHKDEGTSLDTDFGGDVPADITYQVPCHMQAQGVGLKSRDLLRLTGSKITLVSECCGIDGTWGYHAKNSELSQKVAEPMRRGIEKAGGDCVMGDCHLANTAIREQTGRTSVHPVQVLARAYGIPEEK